MSEALPGLERRATGWVAACAVVLLAWAAGLPFGYLLILLHLRVPHVVVPMLLVGWTVVSVLLTSRVRRRARPGGPQQRDLRRSAFATLPQRASLVMNAALLVAGVVAIVLVLLGGTGFSMGAGPEPGLVVVVIGGFLLLAAAAPAAVLNGLWSLDRRTAEEEAAVLRAAGSGPRRVVRIARGVAAITWLGYGAFALLLLVAAVLGRI